ncbi:ankyrin-repeat, SH3-domain, and Proline-rich-region containing Protein isoform X3 [Choristoneura fumiferana]|uniref:ankyrin-repeat, SH3-domain, and Proline-rich-region containing Protein isoform X3 n=1 Tax=Choristoneura fumiferana TaxID=7141 RepID=UPI003D15BA03
MLACVCQPTETALSFRGGPPVSMGPLGASSKPRHHVTDTMKTIKISAKPTRRYSSETKESSPSQTSSPSFINSSGSLLNLRKIERKAKSTKILVNPVCSDSIGTSDDSNRSKKASKWNGKKKRLKSENEKRYQNDETKSDKNGAISRDSSVRENKKSISCFKMKCSEDKSRSDDDGKSGGENCTNENSSNVMNAEKPDLINHSIINSKEILVDENTIVGRAKTDQTVTGKTDSVIAVKENELGEGVELTLGELRAMALRQQQQIDTQHQLLCAKEQRLRYLKQQEARQHQVAVEGERLRRLRERVEAQELKLRRLRALRGQLDRNKQANIALTSDLESIRALFNEKEKELSVAVAKVEELTRQLEELRRGRAQPVPPSAHELDKLRRELMYRNKLNEQQNGRLSAQRAALGARQEEMRSIDRRVSELQARLLRKRALNRQLAAAHRQPQQRTSNQSSMQQLSYPTGQPKSQQPRGNVAAVEPYNHVPHAPSLTHNSNFQGMKQNVIQNNVPLKQLTQSDNIQSHLTQQEAHYLQQKQMINPLYNGGYPHLPPGQDQYQGQYPNKQEAYSHVQQGISHAYDQKTMFDHLNKYSEYPKQPQYSPNSTSSSNSNQNGKELKINEQEFLPEFAASKSDPKYQTLPYNTKFPQTGKLKQPEVNGKPDSQEKNQNANINVNHMTVHSTPLSVVNKSLATPLSQHEATYQQEHAYQLQKSDSSNRCNQEGKENHTYQHNSRLSQSNSQNNDGSKSNGGKSLQGNAIKGNSPSFGSNNTNASSSIGFGIVRNSASGLSSGTGSSNYPGQNSSQSILLSPPQSASTPLSTPDVSGSDKSPKPALPPKPTIKTPPRQSASNEAGYTQSDTSILPTIPVPDSSTDSDNLKELSNGNNSSEMIIKARPLTIRKPPMSEQPKLRNHTNSKTPISVSINRRIEMPPAFLFPEMDHLTLDSVPTEMQNGLKDKTKSKDEVDKMINNNISVSSNERHEDKDNVLDIAEQISSVDLNGQDSQTSENVLRRSKKGNLKQGGKAPLARRVSFDPLALLLDASLEGELELVKKTATQVQNASAANDEGITALHNAICAGHFEIVKFLVELGCDVNAQDSDGWTPLHCAASCNNLPMVRFLVDNGACIFATTLSDHETAAEKCEEDEEGFDGCSEYLYSVQEKLGIMNNGLVYSVFSYPAARPDELSFDMGARLQVLRKGDDSEREWWWCRDDGGQEGYVPRNLLGLYPRVTPQQE